MPNILITGANSGFGLLATRKFASAGHTVYAGFRSPARAAELRALASEFSNIHPVELDVTSQPLIDAAVAEASKTAPIDVLVNNAGFEVVGPIDSLSDELLARQFDTNVIGVVRMIRAVAPAMRARRQGAIINLSSILGWLTLPYSVAYAASKHAVESLSEGLWLELAPFGIRVAVIEPGVFATNFQTNVVTAPAFDASSPHWPHAARFHAAMRALPAGPPSDPQDVADAIFEAATSADPKFRYTAGADARAFIPAYKSQDFESFRAAILTRANLPDWAASS